MLQTFIQQVMMPRSSVQASKMGDDTKFSQIPSKDDLVREATMRVICVAAAVGIYLYLGCCRNICSSGRASI